MRRVSATFLAATIGLGLSGCGTPGDLSGSGASACWGLDGSDASGGGGATIFNDTSHDLVLASAESRMVMNIGSVEYAMGTEHSGGEHEVDGYVVEAGGEAILFVHMTPEDPSEDAALGGIHVMGEHGSKDVTVDVFEEVRYSPDSCD